MKKLLIFDATSVLAENYYNSITKEVEDIENKKSSGILVRDVDFIKAYSTLLNNNGVYINAVQGFFKEFFDAIDKTQPTHVITTWGAERENNSRRSILSSYKNNGTDKSEALLKQQETTIKILKEMGFMVIATAKDEALDLAASIATIFNYKFDSIEIFARNKLSLQLTDIATVWFKTPKSSQISRAYNLNTLNFPKGTVRYNQDLLWVEKGLKPCQIPDYTALIGNSYFGVAGAKEIGVKTATPLIQEFGSIENIYNIIDECENRSDLIELGNSLRDDLMLPLNPIEYLIESREEVFASKLVATYKKDVIDDSARTNLEILYIQGAMSLPTDKKNIIKCLRKYNISAFMGNFTKQVCEVIEDISYSSLLATYNPFIFSPSSKFYMSDTNLSLIPSHKEIDGEEIRIIYMSDDMVESFPKKLLVDVSNTSYYSIENIKKRKDELEEHIEDNKNKPIEINMLNYIKEDEDEILNITSTLK